MIYKTDKLSFQDILLKFVTNCIVNKLIIIIFCTLHTRFVNKRLIIETGIEKKTNKVRGKWALTAQIQEGFKKFKQRWSIPEVGNPEHFGNTKFCKQFSIISTILNIHVVPHNNYMNNDTFNRKFTKFQLLGMQSLIYI